MYEQFPKFPLSPYIWSPWDRESVNILNPQNNIQVAVGDQITQPLVLDFLNITGGTTVAIAASVGDKVITVVDASEASVGNKIIIAGEGAGDVTTGQILSIVGNVISIDTPFEYAPQIGDAIVFGLIDMAVDGSVTPVIFEIPNVSQATNLSEDLTRLKLVIIALTACEIADFGDIPGGLTNGIVLRKNSTISGYTNIWNIKTNAQIDNIMSDFLLSDASNPGLGTYGVSGTHVFAGQQNQGVAIRLEPGDSLELIIQDDLSSLDSFHLIGFGHLVD